VKRRGRPKSNGLLTTRELEVLDLLRQGLSNREIAERLGISLAGAKFHVSEIIGKLGVTSREEAATWRPKVPGVVLPFIGLRRWAPGRIAAMVAAGSAGVLAVVAFVFVLGVHGSEPMQMAVVPTATTVVGMIQTAKEVGSLDEAQRLATFAIVMPKSMPPGYRITSVRYFKPDFRCTEDVDVNHCDRVHNDSVIVRLDRADGRGFSYAQGFAVPIGGSYVFAPQLAKGSVAIEGREVHWVTGHLRPGITTAGGQTADERDWVFDGSIQLAWFQSRDENPTGTDSPHCMGLGSTSLSLEELLDIAASVPQAMAAPALDAYSTRC
jgi:DNA-binding CsgD family transcriptional regulator